MSTHTAVPGDLDPDSFTDLAEDCREVSGVLAPYVIDLTTIPAPRAGSRVIWASAPSLDGYEEYGS